MDFTKPNMEKDGKRKIFRSSDATIWNFLKQDPKKRKKGSSKRLMSATLALRHDVMQGKEQLFIYYF